jgi:hypothetical protein
LASAIKNSVNPYLTALKLAKTNPKYIEDQAKKAAGDAAGNEDPAAVARRVKENLSKPGTGHEMGGAGGGMGKASEYEDMTNDDLELRIAEVKRSGGR